MISREMLAAELSLESKGRHHRATRRSPGHDRERTGHYLQRRHHRACPGDPRSDFVTARKAWMAGTSPAITEKSPRPVMTEREPATTYNGVITGLVPVIHVLTLLPQERRGWPGQARP